MSIKVERKGGKTVVETDYAGSDVAHSMVQNDVELTGAMKCYNIKKVEARNSSVGEISSLHDEFDKEFKKKYGRKYFSPI